MTTNHNKLFKQSLALFNLLKTKFSWPYVYSINGFIIAAIIHIVCNLMSLKQNTQHELCNSFNSKYKRKK